MENKIKDCDTSETPVSESVALSLEDKKEYNMATYPDGISEEQKIWLDKRRRARLEHSFKKL